MLAYEPEFGAFRMGPFGVGHMTNGMEARDMSDPAQVVRIYLDDYVPVDAGHDEATAALSELEAERDKARIALRDFASLVPPRRWRYVRRQSEEQLGIAQDAALSQPPNEQEAP